MIEENLSLIGQNNIAENSFALGHETHNTFRSAAIAVKTSKARADLHVFDKYVEFVTVAHLLLRLTTSNSGLVCGCVLVAGCGCIWKTTFTKLEEILLLSFSVPFNYNFGGIRFATRPYDIVTITRYVQKFVKQTIGGYFVKNYTVL